MYVGIVYTGVAYISELLDFVEICGCLILFFDAAISPRIQKHKRRCTSSAFGAYRANSVSKRLRTSSGLDHSLSYRV